MVSEDEGEEDDYLETQISDCWLTDDRKQTFNRFGYTKFVTNEIMKFIEQKSGVAFTDYFDNKPEEITDLLFQSDDADEIIFTDYFLRNLIHFKEINNNLFPLVLEGNQFSFDKYPLPPHFFGIKFEKHEMFGGIQLSKIFNFPSVFPKIKKIDSLNLLNLKTGNYYVSERFDGQAAVWTGKELLSKNGKLQFRRIPKKLQNELTTHFAEEILLGVMVAVTPNSSENRNFFTKKNVFSSITKKTEPSSEKTNTNCQHLKFCVYDIASYKHREKPFEERYEILQQNKTKLTELIVIDQVPLRSSDSNRNEDEEEEDEEQEFLTKEMLLEKLAMGFLQYRKGAVITPRDATFYELYKNDSCRMKIGVKVKLLAKILPNFEEASDSSVPAWNKSSWASNATALAQVIFSDNESKIQFVIREESKRLTDFPIPEEAKDSMDENFKLNLGSTQSVFITAGDFKNSEIGKEDTRYMGAHVVYSLPTQYGILSNVLTLENSFSPKEVGKYVEQIYEKKFGTAPTSVNDKLLSLGYFQPAGNGYCNFSEYYFFSSLEESHFKKKKLATMQGLSEENKKKIIYSHSENILQNGNFFDVDDTDTGAEKFCWFATFHQMWTFGETFQEPEDEDSDEESSDDDEEGSGGSYVPNNGDLDGASELGGSYGEESDGLGETGGSKTESSDSEDAKVVDVVVVQSEIYFPFEYVYEVHPKFHDNGEIFCLNENETYDSSNFQRLKKTDFLADAQHFVQNEFKAYIFIFNNTDNIAMPKGKKFKFRKVLGFKVKDKNQKKKVTNAKNNFLSFFLPSAMSSVQMNVNRFFEIVDQGKYDSIARNFSDFSKNIFGQEITDDVLSEKNIFEILFDFQKISSTSSFTTIKKKFLTKNRLQKLKRSPQNKAISLVNKSKLFFIAYVLLFYRYLTSRHTDSIIEDVPFFEKMFSGDLRDLILTKQIFAFYN